MRHVFCFKKEVFLTEHFNCVQTYDNVVSHFKCILRKEPKRLKNRYGIVPYKTLRIILSIVIDLFLNLIFYLAWFQNPKEIGLPANVRTIILCFFKISQVYVKELYMK